MRITGRQLRQIIQEEVARMMNEEDAPMPVAANIGEALKGARDLETLINESMGTDFGSVQNFISTAYNGRNPQNAAKIKQLLASPEAGGGFMMNFDDYLPGMIKIVYASVGQPCSVGIPKGPPLNSINGQIAFSSTSSDAAPVVEAARSAALFLKKHFGA